MAIKLYARVRTRPTRGQVRFRWVAVDFARNGKPMEAAGATSYTVRVDGKFVKETRRKSLPEAIAELHRQEALRNGSVAIPKSVSARNATDQMTISSAAAEYLTRQRNRILDWRAGSEGGLSRGSVVVISTAIKNFEDSCKEFGATHMSEFRDRERGRAILLYFRDWLRNNTKRRAGGKPAYTDGKKLIYVSEFLALHRIKLARDKRVNWDGDPGLLEWIEIPRTKPPKVADVIFYNAADLKAMWQAAAVLEWRMPWKITWGTEDYRDLIAILTLTGMRDEEVQYLEWSDFRGVEFRVQDKPQYDWKPKNGERTVTPIEHFSEKLRDRMQARRIRMGVSGLVFPTSVGSPDQNFAERIQYLQKTAIQNGHVFSPKAHYKIVHNFRRSFATILNSCYGLSAPTVQHRIGDADLETTQRYLGKVDDPAGMRKRFESIPFGPPKVRNQVVA
jgi:integrase